MKSSQFLDKLSQVVLVVIFLAILAFLAWASHRGLDITDEGLYLLAARHPHDVLVSVTSAHYFTNLLFHAVGFNVAAFRTAAGVMLLLSGAGAGWASYQVIRQIALKNHSLGDSLAFAAFGGIGAAVYFVWGLLSPGYNVVISMIVNLSLITFSWLALEKDSRERPHSKACLWALFQGMLLGMAILTKVTSGLLLSLITILWLMATERDLRLKLFRLLSLAGGFLILMVIFFVFLESPAIWYERYIKNTFQAVAITGHLPGHLIIKYGYDLLFSSISTFSNSSYVFLLLATILYAFLKRRAASFLTRVNFPMLVLLICLFLDQREYCLGGYDQLPKVYQYYLFFSLSALTLFCLRTLLSTQEGSSLNLDQAHIHALNRRQKAYLITLFILPFAASAGTANPIVFNALMTLSPWFCAYLLLFALMGEVLWNRAWTGVILMLTGLLAASQICSALVIFPYGVHTNLFLNTYPQELGDPPSRLYLDATTQQFIKRLEDSAAANGFRKGDNVLAFTDMPGLVFALGGRSPGTPWWAGKWGVLRNNKQYNEFILSLVPKESLSHAIILQKMDDLTGMPDFKKAGIMFPDNYKMFDEITWSHPKVTVRLWKPQADKKK